MRCCCSPSPLPQTFSRSFVIKPKRSKPEQSIIVYNFDLGSLNFAFRHLAEPEKSFTLGIADPTLAEQGPVFAYKGEVEVKFVGEEKREGVLCRKCSFEAVF